MLGSLRASLEPRLRIDSRALGAFRIALGLLILVDLVFIRFPGLRVFYTDDGVFPRSALADTYPTFAAASIHAVSGSAWVQGTLFAIAGCFAVSLLVGYRTRLSSAVSFVLLASLLARNPHVVNGGDTILLTFLFFGLFLPLDERWSVGGNRHEADQRGTDTGDEHDGHRRVYSLATAVVLLHLVTIYVANALLKLQSDAWMTGRAVPQIFHLEMYAAGLGRTLTEYSLVLTGANWMWLALHVVAIFLVFYTGWPRIALVAAFVAGHLGMAATMRLGILPFVMVAGLLLFVPPQVWDRVDGLGRTVTSSGRSLPLTGRSNRRDPDGRTGGGGGSTAIASVPHAPAVRRGVRIGSVVLLVGFLLTSVLWQTSIVGLVDTTPSAIDDDLADGSWAFFAPNPPDTSSWYVVEVTLESGETIDPTTDDAVTFDRPPDVAATYPTVLWQRYGFDIRFADGTHYEPAATYVCQNVDRNAESVTLHHVQQPVESDGPVGEPIPNERITTAC